jgi:ATP-dependent RNA helicase DDX19/DBP5
LTDIFKVINIT